MQNSLEQGLTSTIARLPFSGALWKKAARGIFEELWLSVVMSADWVRGTKSYNLYSHRELETGLAGRKCLDHWDWWHQALGIFGRTHLSS